MVSPCASEATAIAWEIDGAKELIATVFVQIKKKGLAPLNLSICQWFKPS